MYKIFREMLGSPIVLIGAVLLVIILFTSVSGTISNLGTMLGFNTKENIQKELSLRENELKQVIDINQENEKVSKTDIAIAENTKDKIIDDMNDVKTIDDEERRILEEISNVPDIIVSNDEHVQEPSVIVPSYTEEKLVSETKKKSSIIITNMSKKTSNAVIPVKLTNKNIAGLKALMKQSKEFKGYKI